MSARPFYIDTDTASDDAVALALALTDDRVDIVGIGVVERGHQLTAHRLVHGVELVGPV